MITQHAEPHLETIDLARVSVQDLPEARRFDSGRRFLVRADAALASSLDVDVLLERLSAVALPALGDWCAVHVRDAGRRVHRVATAGVQPPARPNEGSSTLSVPLVADTRVLGAITLARAPRSACAMGDARLDVARELGRRAGRALDQASVQAERVATATALESALQPPRLPVVPGLTLAARFRPAGPATTVGGDFYDVFPVEGGWMIILGDVMGKGPAAAAVTALARFTARTAAKYERSPARVLARLNEMLAVDIVDSPPCTAVCLRLETRPEALCTVVASAGHPPPLVVGPDGVVPMGGGGPILGAFETGSWPETVADLSAGEVLVLYTDGVTDTRGTPGRFGNARLAALLGSCARSPEAIASRIDEGLLEFEVGPQADDIALLAIGAAGDGRT
jgi:sigma-B regulation protein RsbU (phosphoserine phosphatase)